MASERGTSLRRALSLLASLGADDAISAGGLGVTRLAELVHADKSQVSRTLRTLNETGFVERDADTLLYRLGWRMFLLAGRAGDRRLVDAAPPVLLHLVAELGERSHLSVLQGVDVLTVLTESPPHALQTVAWVGRTAPVHCTSSGRSLLMDAERTELEALLADYDFGGGGPNAPDGVAALHERITAARLSGYAVVDEELEPGVVAVSAPVRDAGGRVVAAVNVSAPKFRMGERLTQAGECVKQAAESLSRKLGWSGAP
ncbi:MAG: IclR family transcriptional regulator [Actinobacteria bacterium]|nr:IclR family transcriptional regulator [Actinomycetota bacterium]